MSKAVCLICRKDAAGEAPGVKWVQCVDCFQWYHNDCLGLDDLIQVFTCEPCVKMQKMTEHLTSFSGLEERLDRLLASSSKIIDGNEKKQEKKSLFEYQQRKEEEERKRLEEERKPDDEERDTKGDLKDLVELQKTMMSRQYLSDLPEFSGDPAEWPLFYAQFLETTRQGQLDDGFNVCRLRKALKGPALNAVKGALFLPNNLASVLSILKKRFGNEETIVKKKLKGLEQLSLANEAKPATIKSMFEYLQDLRATLVNLEAHTPREIFRSKND